MPLVQVKGRQTSSVAVESEGALVYVRAMRDGSIINVPWIMAKAIEGKVHAAQTGIMTGEETFATGITAAKPDLWVGVPEGTTIIPVYIGINFEDTGTAEALDVFACASNIYNVATTGTAITIANMRTDKALGGSQCKCLAVSTGTDPESGNYVEFWRPYAGLSKDNFACSKGWDNEKIGGSFWMIGDAVVPPVIVGEGSLNIYAGASAGKGFITTMWVEEPSANLI